MVVEIITWVDTRYYWDRNNPNKKYCSIQLSNPELTDFRYLSDSDLLPKVGTIVVVDLSNKIAQPLPENPDWEKVWDVLLDKENSIFVLPNNLQQNFYKTFEDILKKKIHDINSQCNIIHNLLRLDSLSDEAKDFFQKVLKRIEEEQKKRNDFLSSVKQASIIFDIEGNQIGRTWEYAYKLGDDENVVSHERTYLKSGALKYLSPIDWTDFYMAIKDRDIVIGHNIKEWDCKMILEKFDVSPIVINHDRIWDTLEIDVLLHPDRKYYGLNAENGHIAKNDVIAAEKLFWNQVAEILKDKQTYDDVVSALPKAFKELVGQNQEYVFGASIHSILSPLTTNQEDILYIPRETQSLDINPSEKTLIVAFKNEWPQISRIINTTEIDFIFDNNRSSQLWEYNSLDLNCLGKLKMDKDIFKKALALRAESLKKNGKLMRLCDIPSYFRVHLTDDFLRKYIRPSNGHSAIRCIEPYYIDKNDNVQWRPNKILFIHFDGFPMEISCNPTNLFEFAIALDDYSEYKKTFSLDKDQTKELAREKFCHLAKYWLYQPYPKELHLLYSLEVQSLKNFVREKYRSARISEITTPLANDSRILSCLFNNDSHPDDNNPSDEIQFSYWNQQLSLFDSISAEDGPKVFILASEQEKNDIVNHFKVIKKNFFFTGKIRPYEVLDKLIENTGHVGVMSLKDLLEGEKIVFPAGFTFVLNSLAFCDTLDTDNVKNIVCDILNRLSVYSISPSTLYIIDSRIEKCGFRTKRHNVSTSFNDSCIEESIMNNIIHSKRILEDSDFEDVVKWIEKTWAIPEHEEVITDGVVIEPKGHLYSIQKQAIERVIKYKGSSKNFLTIMPTGKGKSVVFQGPLMYKHLLKNSKRLSLVITPLQALMKNQVEDLQRILIQNELRTSRKLKSKFKIDEKRLKEIIDKLVKGETLPCDLDEKLTRILLKLNVKYKNTIAYINSSTTKEQNKQILKAISDNSLALLYIAPERLMYRSFYRFIETVSFKQGLDSIIFDEAHCITGWGLEFRPDYVLAARKCIDIQRKHPEVSIQLFTATLPEQAKKELFKFFHIGDCNILPKPGTDDFTFSLCPIREHIEIKFEKVEDALSNNENDTIPESKIIRVVKLLKEELLFKNLYNGNSRAIVFTKKRDEAEECSRRLKDKFSNSVLNNKIDYFHAGRSNKEKEEIIRQYESGEILILCSTKAFGLGMNIGNIHSVIHLTPPSFIEDYLQEVGRAGRNQATFRRVFEESGKIQATCLYAPSDMERTVQQLQDEELRWEHIKSAFNEILNYKNRFGNKDDHTLVIPLNLSKSLHQCLGWLSDENGLNRISLLFRSPYSYQLEVLDKTGISEASSLFSLVSYISKIKDSNTISGGIVRVDANGVFEEISNISDINELESVIREGISLGVLSRDTMYVNVSLRKNIKNEVLRMKDDKEYIIPHLTILYALLSGKSSDVVSDNDYSRIAQLINERISFFRCLSLIYSIDEIRDGCRQLLIAILDGGDNSISWNAVKEAVSARTDPNKAEIFLLALSQLNLINLGDTCSDYIEIKITHPKEIDDEYDKKIKENLERFNQNRILKNDAMYAMIDLYENSENTKDFIRQYSAIGDDNLNGFEPISKYSARISLEKAIESGTLLNEEQRNTYNLPNNLNIFVSAGAGSGKTRLLIYRALKLILCQSGVDESEVLILAYNRAVADEVSKRMDEYARDIHYVLRNKNIYTFHGFACRHLPHLLDKKYAFNTWETELLDDILKHPLSYKKYRHILVDEFQDVTSTRLQIIRELIRINNATTFVIGDMAQSIYGYEKKADVKKRFSNRGIESIRKFAVIRPDKRDEFDEFNNEVAWDRITECVSIDPSDYHLIDGANEQTLKNNYRSYQTIINTSVRWLEGFKLGTPELISQVHDSFEPPSASCICPMPGADWIKDLVETILPTFLQNRKTWEKTIKHDDEQINPFTTICILFRTNSDVHDAYSKLKQEELQGNPEIIIQGSDFFYQFTREFFFFSLFLAGLKKKQPNSIIKGYSFIEEYTKTNVNEDDSVIKVAKQVAEIIIKNNPGLTYSRLYDEFVAITSEERERLKEYIDRQLAPDKTDCKIVLSTIHRVKGMEYDAVIVPASTYPIDLDYDDLSAEESNEEERRLMYVAFSRAKRMLYYYVGEREKAILQNQQYKGENNRFYAKDGLSAVDISFAAQGNENIRFYQGVPNNCFFDINRYIEKNVKTDDPIILKRKVNRGWPDEWCIYHGESLIGRLSRNNKLCEKLNQTELKKVSGLFIKAVCVCEYYDQDQAPEEQRNNRRWCDNAQKQGYVYYVDYYGCAEPLNDE